MSSAADTAYPDTRLFIDDQWTDSADGRTIDVLNPADGQVIGTVARASTADLDRALAAADRGFAVWRDTTPARRESIMRAAAPGGGRVVSRPPAPVRSVAGRRSVDRPKPTEGAESHMG